MDMVGLKCFPRPFAAASLKQIVGPEVGLIVGRFPRPFAAASLKRDHSDPGAVVVDFTFSAAIRRGLIEAASRWDPMAGTRRFSAAIRRGLIEATCTPLARRS